MINVYAKPKVLLIYFVYHVKRILYSIYKVGLGTIEVFQRKVDFIFFCQHGNFPSNVYKLLFGSVMIEAIRNTTCTPASPYHHSDARALTTFKDGFGIAENSFLLYIRSNKFHIARH